MQRLSTRVFVTLATVALILAALVPQSTSANPVGGSARFQLDPSLVNSDAFSEFVPAVLPIGMDPAATVRVVVRLAGDPVALVKAAKPAKQISQAERDAVTATLQIKQAALTPQIEALGGTVLAQFQSALNGIKVEIARSKLSALQSLTGVEGINTIEAMTSDNSTSVPYLGTPTVWAGQTGFRGERIKVGIIDTGIDYTHANFGGPGTAAAYVAAQSSSTLPADAALFGPNAPKVKGGIDLVGDDYDANVAGSVPVPDPNPLDCNGHGSHVAGTVAGFGVTGTGATYNGVYDTTTNFASLSIGPGVAPKADLYAIRVFGCNGSTDVTVDAIDWAVAHDLDVINMSLGSTFGSADDASAVASDNAAKSGIVVVASAGNSGRAPYITGSPATATRAISVAANDATPTFPGATIGSGASAITALNANAATFANGLTLPVKVVYSAPGVVSLGCSTAAFTAAGVAGTIAVVSRGTCARVAKAIYGQDAGALAVVMINTSNTYPPFEGRILSNPDTGAPANVTIPFLGVKSSSKAPLLAKDGTSVALNNANITNPAYTAVADFSSGGPRRRDSALKPDVAAPGVSTLSTASGTGNLGERLSGTSMAAPHVTGVAALVLQSMGSEARGNDEDGNGIAERVKAAITNTASSAAIAGYTIRMAGSGLVQPVGASKTRVVVTGGAGTGSLSFGFLETRTAFSATKKVTVRALDRRDQDPETAARFNVTSTPIGATPHNVTLSKTSVRIMPGESTSLNVTLKVDPANSIDAGSFQDVAGTIDFTPVGGTNNSVTLRVPYYMVLRGTSNGDAALAGVFNAAHPTQTVGLTNAAGAVPAMADFYSWGISSPNAGHGQTDLRAAGVQQYDFPSTTNPTRKLLVFAVNTWERYSNAAVNEYDVNIDVNNDGVYDYVVVGADHGLITAGSRDGQFATFVFNLHTGSGSQAFAGTFETDNSTVLMPVLSSQLATGPATGPRLSASNPRFTYEVDVYAGRDGTDDVNSATAKFNAFSPSMATGQGDLVNPNGTASDSVAIDPTEWANTPALGQMIVYLDNASGAGEAKLLPVTP